MTFLNKEDGNAITLEVLKACYLAFRAANPEFYPETFKSFLYMFIYDALNGRNDYKLENITSNELIRFLNRIK